MVILIAEVFVSNWRAKLDKLSLKYDLTLFQIWEHKNLGLVSFSLGLDSLRKILGEGGGKSNWTLRLLRRVEMLDRTGTCGEKQLSDATDKSVPKYERRNFK